MLHHTDPAELARFGPDSNSGPVPEARKTIRLAGIPGGLNVARDDVYFAFGNGRFDYDCITCNAKCCRGFGYMVNQGEELGHQLTRRSLPLFATPARLNGGTQLRVLNCAPGCFFLSEDGLCEVHAAHGAAAKPETCRLFPFNSLALLGKYLIVRPHESLCPISIVRKELTSDRSSYDGLLAELTLREIHANIPRCDRGADDPDTTIARERRIVQLCDQCDSTHPYTRLVRDQLIATRSEDVPSVEQKVGTALELLRSILGIAQNVRLGQDRSVTECMVATTPFLRSQMVLVHNTASEKAVLLPMHPERVPYALLCIYLVVEAARDAGMKRISFETVSHIERQFRPVVRLLSSLDEVMVLQRGAPITMDGFDTADLLHPYIRLVQVLLPNAQRRFKRTLGELLLAHLPSEALPRSLFLKMAANHLVGRLVPLKELDDVRYKTRGVELRVRTAVQRFAFAHMPSDMLVTAMRAGERRSGSMSEKEQRRV